MCTSASTSLCFGTVQLCLLQCSLPFIGDGLHVVLHAVPALFGCPLQQHQQLFSALWQQPVAHVARLWQLSSQLL